MKNLFIIRSPLQLINCMEAISYFNLENDNNILVIIYNNTNNTKEQINKLINKYKWYEIIKINQKKKKSKFFDYILLINKLKKQSYNYLFVGDFGTIYKLIIANTLKKQVWYVDDGVITFKYYEELIKPKKINKFNLRMIRFLFIGLKINIQDNINFFTYFDLETLPNIKIINNNLFNFKQLYMKNIILDNVTYILGQPLFETNLLKEDDYFECIDNIIKTISTKIVYIPHRTEKINNRHKSYINNNFEIRDINMPVELYFLEQNIEPYSIISFMTTAFFTLKKIYPNTKYGYYYISSSKILQRKQDVQRAYDKVKSLGIEQINK